MFHLWLIGSKFSTASALAFFYLLCVNHSAKALEDQLTPASDLIPPAASTLGHDVVSPSIGRLSQANIQPSKPTSPDSVKLEDVLPPDTASPGADESPGAIAPPTPTPEAALEAPPPKPESPTPKPDPSTAPSTIPNQIPNQTPAPVVTPAPAPVTPAAPVDADSIAVPQAGDAAILQQLNPNPNPLLIQTEPNAVEITDTQQITLEQAIELAYRNNPDLQSAFLELQISQAGLREAQAALFPTFAIGGGLEGFNSTSSTPSFIANPDGGLDFLLQTNEELAAAISAQMDLGYRLYTSGGRTAAIRAAEERVRVSELEVRRRQADLRINTTNEYYDLQAAIEAIRISQAFLGEAERNVADTKLRQDAGVGTEFDVLRASVQAANARQDVVNSQRAANNARKALGSRLNLAPNINVTTVPVKLSSDWTMTLEESIVLAYQNRVELEQQLAQREISEQQRRLALSEIGAQVNLFANYGFNQVLNSSGSFNDGYQFGARFSWLLFEGGAARARAAQRQLEGEIIEQNFAQTRNAIRLQVETAYADLQANLENIDTTRLAVEEAKRALDLAILRFDAGVGTQLDILAAQSQLTEAEGNLVRTIVGYNRSLAQLQRAVSAFPEP